MPTRPAEQSFVERAKQDPDFRAALIAEAYGLIADGDVQTAKSILRTYVLAAIGFEALAKEVGKKPESIKRMLSERGNPTLSNIATLISTVSQHEGVTLQVQALR